MPCARPVIVVKNDIRKKKIFQPIEITSRNLYIWISLKLSRKKYDDFQTICIFNLFLYNLHMSPVKSYYSWQVCHCNTKNNCWTHCCHRFYHSLVAVVAIGRSSKLYFLEILDDMTREFYRESASRYQIYNFNRDSQTDNKSSVGRLLMVFDNPWLLVGWIELPKVHRKHMYQILSW